jgi:hypothetical protein
MRRWPLFFALIVACTGRTGSGSAPAPSPRATVQPSSAHFVLPAPDTLWKPAVARTDSQPRHWVWTIGWGGVHSMDWAAFNLVVVVPRPTTHPVAGRRLVQAAKTEYDHVEPAGSITAIGIDRAANARVNLEGAGLVIRWGPSSGLNQLVADRPESVRVTLRGRPDGGYAKFWLRPDYAP